MTDRTKLEETAYRVQLQLYSAKWITLFASITALVMAYCAGASKGWQGIAFIVASILVQAYAFISASGFGYLVAEWEVAESNLQAADAENTVELVTDHERASDENVAR